MVVLLIALMLCLLLRSAAAMDAASAACRLFVTAVLPGLFPYMVLSLMTVSRLSRRFSPTLLMLLGWGGGSPTGARLLPLCPGLTRAQLIRLAVSCATMSPMFLLGTVGMWLDSAAAGAVVLGSVILGGWGAGWIVGWRDRRAEARRFCCPTEADSAGGASLPPGLRVSPTADSAPLSFGAAVEQSARTMLLICGTMVMLRVFAALAAEVLPSSWVLPVTTLLEVTTGAQTIAGLALPLPLRTALIAGATGFGGMAIIMQNRTVYPEHFMSLGTQLLWQAVHGAISFALALGTMLLLC